MENSDGAKHRTAALNAIFSKQHFRNQRAHNLAFADELHQAEDFPPDPAFTAPDADDNSCIESDAAHLVSTQTSNVLAEAAFACDKRSPPAVTRVHEPQVNLEGTAREIKQPAPTGSVKHWFDELKINFLARHKETVKSVLFLSISRGAGASTAALHFARSLAQDIDVRVLLINADLREPGAAPAMDDPGLTDLVEPLKILSSQSGHGHLHVVPWGRGYADPAVLFQSKRFRAFMAQCRQQYDYIVVDGPPLDEAPESIALCTNVDGVILVLDARCTHHRIAAWAKNRIEQAGGTILGVALNRRKFYIPRWLYKLIY
jgi:Mrp family chromosome partitioning ATPase